MLPEDFDKVTKKMMLAFEYYLPGIRCVRPVGLLLESKEAHDGIHLCFP